MVQLEVVGNVYVDNRYAVFVSFQFNCPLLDVTVVVEFAVVSVFETAHRI